MTVLHTQLSQLEDGEEKDKLEEFIFDKARLLGAAPMAAEVKPCNRV